METTTEALGCGKSQSDHNVVKETDELIGKTGASAESTCSAGGQKIITKNPQPQQGVKCGSSTVITSEPDNQEDEMIKVSDQNICHLDKLADICDHVRDISAKISQMEDPLPEQLQQSVPGYLQTLMECSESLRMRRWPIVLAGDNQETKITFLSAITEEFRGVLPDDRAFFTELLMRPQYDLITLSQSDRRHFKINMADNPSEEPFLIDNWEGLTKLRNKNCGKKQCCKTEIYLPVEKLRGGLDFIILPNSWKDHSSTDVLQILSESYGFIYTLDCDNIAETGKLSQLMQLLGGDPSFTKKNTDVFLVVCLTKSQCSKGDDILKRVQQFLLNIPETSLGLLYSGPGDSRAMAIQSLRQTAILKKSMTMMLQKSVEIKVNYQYSWLNSYITRVLHHMRAFLTQTEVSHEERLKNFSLIQQHLEALTFKADEYLAVLREEVDKRVEYSLGLLQQYLRNEDIINKISQWESDDAPSDDQWTDLDAAITNKVNFKIRRELLHWEEHSQYFASVRPQLIEQFNHRFAGIQNDIEVVETMISRRNSMACLEEAPRDTDDSSYRFGLFSGNVQLKWKQKVALGIAAPFILPLALAAIILGLPILGGLAARDFIVDKICEGRLKEYNANKVKYLENRTREEIKKFVKSGGLVDFIRSQLKGAYKCIHQLQNEIPRQIEADHAQLESLRSDDREANDVARFYQPLIEIFEHSKQLLVLYKIMCMTREKVDIPFEDIEIPENTNVICDGLNGTIQTAFWLQKSAKSITLEKKMISLKFLSQKLDVVSVEEYRQEEEASRFQACPNITKFFGVTKYSGFLYHIHEPLKCSLRQYLTHAHETASELEVSESDKFLFMSSKLTQLLRGLDYLHDRSWVHCDLSLDSVAVNIYNQVKLTNISCRRLFQVPRDLPHQAILRYTHLPPEVLSQPPASYTPTSEMYSVGILMWEMWLDQGHAYWKEVNDPKTGLDTMKKFVVYIESNRPCLKGFYKEDDVVNSCYAEMWMARCQQCWSETDRLTCKALLQLTELAGGKSALPMDESYFGPSAEG